MKLLKGLGCLILSFMVVQTAYAANYTLDIDHSSVEFKIKHLISWVRGNFNDFEGSFVYDPESPEAWKVEAVIYPDSIDTGVEERDNHLMSADFFDVETYPEMTFVSEGVTDVTETSAKLHGKLSMHGVEKPVTLDLQIHGTAEDPWGNKIASFTATTTVDRSDFGLNWNEILETGGVLVGKEVKITIEVEGLLEE